MHRRVEPELLDALKPDDPRAVRSRKDLQRVNAWMRNPNILATELRALFNGRVPGGLVDLGAGDGAFMLSVARQVSAQWNGACVCLLDRQNIVPPERIRDFEALGCHVSVLEADVLEWVRQPAKQQFDIIVANLFLHHFADPLLAELLAGAAKRARVFVGVEPRRWAWSLIFSRFLGLIGCNSVTRHDAVVSVRAGFAGQELSRLWPRDESWLIQEGAASWCSHLFIARRRDFQSCQS